jgi:hypothetical protein
MKDLFDVLDHPIDGMRGVGNNDNIPPDEETRVYPLIKEGQSLQEVCEVLSHMEPGWFEEAVDEQ